MLIVHYLLFFQAGFDPTEVIDGINVVTDFFTTVYTQVVSMLGFFFSIFYITSTKFWSGYIFIAVCE